MPGVGLSVGPCDRHWCLLLPNRFILIRFRGVRLCTPDASASRTLPSLSPVADAIARMLIPDSRISRSSGTSASHLPATLQHPNPDPAGIRTSSCQTLAAHRAGRTESDPRANVCTTGREPLLDTLPATSSPLMPPQAMTDQIEQLLPGLHQLGPVFTGREAGGGAAPIPPTQRNVHFGGHTERGGVTEVDGLARWDGRPPFVENRCACRTEGAGVSGGVGVTERPGAGVC